MTAPHDRPHPTSQRNTAMAPARNGTVTLTRCRMLAFLCLLALAWWSSNTPLIEQRLLAQDAANQPATPPAQPPTAETSPDAPLPKLKDMVLPSVEELLRGKPTDWVVMVNQDVLVIEPVSPRPNTLELRRAEYEAMQKTPTTQIALDEKQKRLAELQRISVILPDEAEDSDFWLEVRLIQEIIYFETQLLRRVSRLLDEGDLAPAYDLLMFLERRHRNWPGFDDRYRRFLFLEAGQLADQGEFERAWLSAERLHGLQNDYLNLSRLLGRILDGLMTDALSFEDYRQARHFLARLERLQPDHSAVIRWRDRLIADATNTVTRARSAQAAGEHRAATLLIDHAARIWPELPGLRETHRELTDRYQLLRVGIVRPSLPSGSYPYPTLDDERRRQLCELPLFEPETVRDGVVRFRSRFIESWEPRDLGREVHFRLQMRRSAWESRPILTSGQILDALTDRTSPTHPDFNPRFERELRSAQMSSPAEWAVTLSRIPLRVESRFRFPIALSPTGYEWSGDLDPALLELPLSQRFLPRSEGDDGSIGYRRSRPQQPSPEGWRLAEVLERPFPSWERMLQALLRGEIDMIPHAEWFDLDAINQDQRFRVVRQALPVTHLLQVHPDSVLTRNATLRRALLHGLPRRRILDEQLLQNTRANDGRLVTGPFASSLAAYDRQLRPPTYDLLRAASLAATARRQLGGELPRLKLAVPGDVVSQRAVPELVTHWKKIGVTVEVVAPGNREPWDIAYRTLRLTEPAEDIWSLLTADGSSDWQDLASYPHWLRERLWELEQTIDWPQAQRLLQQIQKEFLLEARWLPLWELEEYVILRRRINGTVNRPLHPYHDCERWTLQAWYPTETP